LEWFARTKDEHNNLRSALEYASKTNIQAGLYISSQLGGFWDALDSREGLRWLTEFLQNPESEGYPHARAKALCVQSYVLFLFGRYDEAQAAAEESLALFRAIGDQQGEVIVFCH
jgi:hypothetical protein